MFQLFRALAERVKALFVTNAALDFECEFLTAAAERQASLLRQADRYDAEGLRGIAAHLRQQAEAIDLNRPLAMTLPIVDHLLGRTVDPEPLAKMQATGITDEAAARKPLRLVAAKKKGRHS
jgi:hypothetical protein